MRTWEKLPESALTLTILAIPFLLSLCPADCTQNETLEKRGDSPWALGSGTWHQPLLSDGYYGLFLSCFNILNLQETWILGNAFPHAQDCSCPW